MDSTPHGAAITAVGLGLKGPRGWVFRDVDVDAPPGSLVAVEGPSGSGRTCLLLTLTGRMRITEGRAAVGGHALPARMPAVRRSSALAHVPGVCELDPALTVAEHLRERMLLQRRFGGPPLALLRRRAARSEDRARATAVLTAAGLDTEALPKGADTAVRDLGRLEALRLSLALALVGGPRLIAVDDTDLKLSDAERDRAGELLRSLAASGTTVLAVCSRAPDGAVVVPTAPAARDAAGRAARSSRPAPVGRLRKGGAADALPATGRA
ncbi:ATP-binding cassette domain-containing protein [Streptomyces sp. SCA3-4]|uniref:ATP-binding cassette domain-containing protein n=1 Tax=Streptomyces sichuanensis TaxID=2871810 RepID=UPI001CE3670B|nr:ATP-binding cassette domain-containing protein [Streptomyces sichuanensis]MCA6096114.1 ATP-binding cassette domain-containing protein [Streptomyces sichuanensis]